MNKRHKYLGLALIIGLILTLSLVAGCGKTEEKAAERIGILCATEGGNCVESWNGSDLVGYSDAGSSQTWVIDTGTGDIDTEGDIDSATGDFEVGGDQILNMDPFGTATIETTTTQHLVEIYDTTNVMSAGVNSLSFLNIDAGIGNSTGGTNSVYGVLVDSITADAQNTEIAIQVSSGWDYAADLDGAVKIDGGLFDVGTGSCSVADGDNDVCIAAVLEVDGELEADGAIDADSTSDFADTATFSKGSGNAISVSAGGNLALAATADLMASGYAAVGNGTPNGDVTAGTDEQLYVEGNVEIDGILNADGAVNADSTLDVAGITTLAGLLRTSFADETITDGETLTPTVTTYALDSAGAVTMTLAASASEGQLLILIGDDANDILIADTNIRTSTGAALTLNQYDIAVFVYQDSEWLELLLIANS